MNIVPKPVSVEYSDGVFYLSSNTRVVTNNTPNFFKDYLCSQCEALSGIKPCGQGNKANEIVLILDESIPSKITDESYELTVTSVSITMRAAQPAGLFYGIQSFLQLLTNNVKAERNSVQIECLVIKDSPVFVWRGMHLDVSRHFFSVNDIKRYIDILALHKINRFHWHLTDDQGWRIEIKQYPLLTNIGSNRVENEGSLYGGYYSQEEIAEVVAYASDRFITIVPEIEMPGHAQAALAAYPELVCTKKDVNVWNEWGISEHVYCAGNDDVFSFLQNVLDEIVSLFPGEYIHIGGDECPKEAWKSCELCQKRIEELHLENENQLQSYFIKRIAAFLNSRKKLVIGWDEIAEGGLEKNAIVMVWQGMDKAREALRQGNKVIMCPTSHCYFDYSQAEENEPKAFNAQLALESVYDFDPLSPVDGLINSELVLGGQGNIWTEYISDFKHLQYMALPRMSAMAEVLWTGEKNKDFSSFAMRLKQLTKLFDKLGINYRPLD
ncbi:MAG: beta-N-acetylhexosaminidase [candidate division Zixibacteria bacterium]|nr:beta-N-acetylhexosaminidase [candidate division Zixibacteria bacterium]